MGVTCDKDGVHPLLRFSTTGCAIVSRVSPCPCPLPCSDDIPRRRTRRRARSPGSLYDGDITEQSGMEQGEIDVDRASTASEAEGSKQHDGTVLSLKTRNSRLRMS